MKISYSPYHLTPVQSLNAVSEPMDREGVLLKIEWPDGVTGYADLHPWPELGDIPLHEQIGQLCQGKISVQMEQSIWLARRDGLLRKNKKNIFDGYERIRNNYLLADYKDIQPGLLDELIADGYTTIKMKVGRNLSEEAEALTHLAAAGLKIRLDFNAIGSWQIFEKFMGNLLLTVRPLIEYVEDPFPYEQKSWLEARKLAKIAVDNQYDKIPWDQLQQAPCDVIVIKPAKTDVDKAIAHCQKWNLKATVTSYMDHPVGISHAVGVAMELRKKYGTMILEAGCLTHRLYLMDAFSAELNQQGPYLMKSKGTGVGFNDLLEAMPWYQVKLS